MKSSSTTVEGYLKELPPDRLPAITAVRQTILKALPAGYEEAMNWGLISYQVPLKVYADTYNKKPLMYAGLASQKNYMAIYSVVVYGSPVRLKALQDGFAKAGKKLDMGKGCIRFKKLEDIDLPTISAMIASVPMDKHVAFAKSNWGKGK